MNKEEEYVFREAMRNGNLKVCEVYGNKVLLDSYRLATQPKRVRLFALLDTDEFDGKTLNVIHYSEGPETMRLIYFSTFEDDAKIETVTVPWKQTIEVMVPPKPGFWWDTTEFYWVNAKGHRIYCCL